MVRVSLAGTGLVFSLWLVFSLLTVAAWATDPPLDRERLPAPPFRTVWHRASAASGGSSNPPVRPAADAVRKPRIDSGPTAEFDQQKAIVMAWREDETHPCRVQLEIARAVCESTNIIVVVPPQYEIDAVTKRFRDADVLMSQVVFLPIPVNTVWIRDYGPFLIRRDDGTQSLIDAAYGGAERLDDDAFPKILARHVGMRTEESALTIEGGNLLTNGEGLLITTAKTLTENQLLGFTVKEVHAKLRKTWNVRDLVVLDTLAGEPTGHVDMFATFVDSRTVVVAEIDPKVDELNSRLLDRAAHTLSERKLEQGSLRIARIPMPPQRDETKWPTYTNVVFANGVLLVPYYVEQDETWHQAAAVYSRLLPKWKIVGINCTEIIGMGGALHCLTLNLSDVRMLTDVPEKRGMTVVRFPD